MPDSAPPNVVAGVPDLFFGSKISGAAKLIGLRVTFAQTQEALLRLSAEGPSLIVLDLGAASLDPIGAVRALRSNEATRNLKLIAFANHERGDLIEAAREAGVDNVLTRGAFSASLPEMLRGLLPRQQG